MLPYSPNIRLFNILHGYLLCASKFKCKPIFQFLRRLKYEVNRLGHVLFSLQYQVRRLRCNHFKIGEYGSKLDGYIYIDAIPCVELSTGMWADKQTAAVNEQHAEQNSL